MTPGIRVRGLILDYLLIVGIFAGLVLVGTEARRHRSVPTNEAAINSLAHLLNEAGFTNPGDPGTSASGVPQLDGAPGGLLPGQPNNAISVNPDGTPAQQNTPVEFIWSKQTVAAGDTAVLHCSFDAIFQQLRTGNIDWVKESTSKDEKSTLLATGKKAVTPDRRYRVYRPHNSALSVLIIRRAKKRDAGIYRCNLSGSSTRHKYLILNVTESKIEAHTSPAKLKARIGKDVTLWCNATGYPRPVVYWTREDSNRRLPDGSYQFWGNGLSVKRVSETDTGIYSCYLDNFVQPVVSYRFNLVVEDRPWHLDGYKMRFDSSEWFPHNSITPRPVQGKSFLLMCETRGLPRPLPKIRWFKNDRELRANKHFYIIEDKPEWRHGYVSSTLVIMKFVPRHQANYTCMASNNLRSNAKEFFITEFFGPDQQDKPISVTLGTPILSTTSQSEPSREDNDQSQSSSANDNQPEEGSAVMSLEDDEDYNMAGSGSGNGGFEEEYDNSQPEAGNTGRDRDVRLKVKPGWTIQHSSSKNAEEPQRRRRGDAYIVN